MRTSGRTRRVIAVLALLAYLPACYAWRSVEVAPQQLIAERAPDWLRVTTRDGARFALYEPTIRGDSLAGIRDGPADVRGRRQQAVTVALADVTQVELRRSDGGKTGVAVVVAAAALTALVVVGCSTGRCGGLTRSP